MLRLDTELVKIHCSDSHRCELKGDAGSLKTNGWFDIL